AGREHLGGHGEQEPARGARIGVTPGGVEPDGAGLEKAGAWRVQGVGGRGQAALYPRTPGADPSEPAVVAEGGRAQVAVAAGGGLAGEVVERGAERGAELARAEALHDVAAASAVAEHGVGPLDLLDPLADDPHVQRPEVLGVEG